MFVLAIVKKCRNPKHISDYGIKYSKNILMISSLLIF